ARSGFPLAGPLTGVGIRLVSGVASTCAIFPPNSAVKNVAGEFAAKGPTAVPDDCEPERLRRGGADGHLNPGRPGRPPPPGGPIDPPCLMSSGTSELLPIPCL